MKTRIFSTAMVALTAVMLISSATLATGKEFKSASSLEHVSEQNLKIENWMVDFSMWNHASVYHILPASDKMNSLEFWMVHPAVWEVGIDATEESLSLEAWMYNSIIWEAGIEVAEAVLPLEAWMYNSLLWEAGIEVAEESLHLEAWMTSTGLWDAFEVAAEDHLVLEAWMLEDACWVTAAPALLPATDGKLTLEAWMTYAENWK